MIQQKIPQHRCVPLISEMAVSEEAYLNIHLILVDLDKQCYVPLHAPLATPEELAQNRKQFVRLRRLTDGIGIYEKELAENVVFIPSELRPPRMYDDEDEVLNSKEKWLEEKFLPVLAWSARDMIEIEIQHAIEREDYRLAAQIRSFMENKKLEV